MGKINSSKSGLIGSAFKSLAAVAKGVSTKQMVDKSESMKLSEDFSHIYLFKNPQLYFQYVLFYCYCYMC